MNPTLASVAIALLFGLVLVGARARLQQRRGGFACLATPLHGDRFGDVFNSLIDERDAPLTYAVGTNFFSYPSSPEYRIVQWLYDLWPSLRLGSGWDWRLFWYCWGRS